MKPYYIFDEPIPEELCEIIIRMGLEAQQLQADVHKNDVSVRDNRVRSNTISWLSEPSISELMGEYVKHANVEAGWNFHINYHHHNSKRVCSSHEDTCNQGQKKQSSQGHISK